MFYDLHIHSCLSPCADDAMTPHNICRMALIKGLQLIAVSDHNTTRQQIRMAQAARDTGIGYLYGIEMESREEVHVLGYFHREADLAGLQRWLDAEMPVVPNRPDFFGNQILVNEKDEPEGTEERLLLVSLKASLEACVEEIHACHGTAVLAHVMDQKNGIINQLGFIPENLGFDGLEISEGQQEVVLRMHPWLRQREVFWLTDSDAHQLVDIAEAEHELSAAARKGLGLLDD
jgi:hypothetical protein